MRCIYSRFKNLQTHFVQYLFNPRVNYTYVTLFLSGMVQSDNYLTFAFAGNLFAVLLATGDTQLPNTFTVDSSTFSMS